MPEPSRIRLLTGTQLLQEQRNGTLILDTRAAERFASFHIRGAIQIGLIGPFASWAAILIKPTQKLALVVENKGCAEEAHSRLARVGLERVIGYSVANETQWRKENVDLTSISTQQCRDIRQTLEIDPSLQLVDIRSHAEWLKGHLPGAVSVPLLHFESRAQLIDPSRASLVYCDEGFRAMTAASILLREGSGNIGILIDGVEGWCASGLPLEIPQGQ